MAKGVFIHNPGTQYDDDPATRYHFPKQYFKRAQPVIDDHILYYQSGKKGGYTGTAIVDDIVPDIKDPQGHFYANVCLLYTSPSPRDQRGSRMPSSA